MLPIILPPTAHPAWARAEMIAKALRAKGKSNPVIIAAIANGYAESAWTAVVAGDHGKSFGPWQMNWVYYGAPILSAIGVDIRTETDLAKHVDAVLWALNTKGNVATLVALDAATTGAEATRIWCAGFERAGAANAIDRRVAIAGPIEAWWAKASG